jgi:hypothetical protein
VAGESSYAFPTRGGPDFDLAVVRAGDNQVILERKKGYDRGRGLERGRTNLEFDASQPSVVALERLEAFPGGNIPHHHLPIATGANDLVALESNGIHWTLMSLEGSEELKRVSIPDTDEGVFGAANDVLVVDTKIEDTSSVSGEDGGNLGPGSISK